MFHNGFKNCQILEILKKFGYMQIDDGITLIENADRILQL